MMFRINQHQDEPAACETLYMATSWLPEGKTESKIAVGATEQNAAGEQPVVSLQIITFDTDWRCSVGAAWLTFQETDMLVAALIEAKARLMALCG